MRVAIVGHTGNVGSGLVRALAARQDAEVTGVARRRPRPIGPWARVDARQIDVSEPTSVPRLAEAFRGKESVVHLAWALQPNHDVRSIARTNLGGLEHVLAAAVDAKVAHVVVASSVGAYSFGPKHRGVDESWPTGGIASSHYSRHKAQTERMLDRFVREHPTVTITRLRPGLVMQEGAASEIARLFLGAMAPLGRLVPALPVLPVPSRVRSQVVHADDLAAAIVAALERRVGGALNLAADPPIGPEELSALLGARWVPIRQSVLRATMSAAWHARLLASDPGWLDLAAAVPIMDTGRARSELDWTPTRSGIGALGETIAGVVRGARIPASPSLR